MHEHGHGVSGAGCFCSLQNDGFRTRVASSRRKSAGLSFEYALLKSHGPVMERAAMQRQRERPSPGTRILCSQRRNLNSVSSCRLLPGSCRPTIAAVQEGEIIMGTLAKARPGVPGWFTNGLADFLQSTTSSRTHRHVLRIHCITVLKLAKMQGDGAVLRGYKHGK